MSQPPTWWAVISGSRPRGSASTGRR